LVALVAGLVWQFTPAPAIFAISNLSDPGKLATLGERGANPRLNKIVYWLHEGQSKGMSPATTIKWSQFLNGSREPRASLVKESLLRNLQIGDRLGLLTSKNLERLRHGSAAIVTSGPYAKSPVEIDHIVPISLAPELGNELANLEMLPEPLNRKKSNRVGERQLAMARRFREAGLLSIESMARLEAHGTRR
jgi:5-methylcytosine-specific restriction endonuclease McrA